MYAIVDIGGWSNSPEPFCEITPKKPVPLELIEEQINSIPDQPIFLQGAEPLIHPNFAAILEYCQGRDLLVPTNARLCFYSTVAQDLAKHKVTMLVNLYGPKEVHEKLTNGNYEQTVTGIKNLLAANAKVAVRIPVLHDNLHHLTEAIDDLVDLGLKEIIVSLPSPTGPLAKRYNVPQYSSAKPILDEIFDGYQFAVRASGFVPCQLQSHHDHLISLPYDAQRTKIDVCKTCEHNPDCRGMFAAYHNKYGDGEFSLDKPKPETQLEELCAKLNKSSLLFISPDNVMELVNYLQSPKSIWDLSYHSGYPVAITAKIVRALIEEKIIKEDNLLSLQNDPSTKPKPIIDPSTERLPSDPQFTQLTVCQEDLKARVEYVSQTVPAGGKLVVLGDDDFIGLLFASTGLFDVTILEIDPNICQRIREVAEKENLKVNVVQHDLREPIPDDLKQTMDIFYTDSPYTLNGFSLFISRGIEFLKPGPKKHGFSSFSPEMPELELVELPVQKAIAKMNLFIERKRAPGRNDVPQHIKSTYPTLSAVESALQDYKTIPKNDAWYFAALGRKEYMFHFLTTTRTTPIISGKFDKEIYYVDNPLAFYADKEFIQRMKNDFSYLDY